MKVMTEITVRLDETELPCATRLTGGAVALHDLDEEFGYSIHFLPCDNHIEAVRKCLHLLIGARLERANEEKNDAD